MVAAELEPNEDVLWVDQPMAGRLARKTWPIVLFAIPWTAFSVFWIYAAAGFQVPKFGQVFEFFPLFGVPFVLIGIGMFCSPLWMRFKAVRTVYVLTDRRAIVFDGGRSMKVRSFGPEFLKNLERTQHADGSGDLVFDKIVSYHKNGGSHHQEVGFLAIANVKDVEGQLRKVWQRALPRED